MSSANLYSGLTADGNSGKVRVLGVYVALLVVVSVLTHQYWLLPAGLILGGLGVLLTRAS